MSTNSKRLRVLSGVQPSGKLHLGNYFGAIRQHIALQDTNESFYFIADYHAMTTLQNPQQLRDNVRDVALDYLALGLDPNKAAFFRQSDVPEVTELTWFLSTVAGMGLLERAHSYKDKVARGISPSVGLFTYPILMAADILAYRSNLVPVGQDQVQHLEMTRDMAGSFNSTYQTDLFPLPEARLDVAAVVPGIDGKKMSKSYQNTIDIFAEGKPLKKTVMSIVTDSTPLEAPKNPDTCNVFALYKLFASETEQQELADKYLAGGMGYGTSKTMLLEKIEGYFAPARARRKELAANLDYVEQVLKQGAAKARHEAQLTMEQARRIVGLR
ncbi:MAG: tryptophan--tRNA ligase [Planctomycetia bacterium]|nr:tryptophan--tRNA ligase [Planctomycetia bacterium]